MKKTLLALAVPALLAASAANAANIYKTDSKSLDMYGRVYMTVDADNNSNTTMIGKPRFGFKGTSKVNDDMSAFFKAEWEVSGQTGGDTDPDDHFHSRYVYLGFDFNEAGSVTLGQFYPANYTHLLVLTDIFNEFGMNSDNGLYGVDRESSQVSYANTFGPVSMELNYQFNDQNNKATIGGTDTSGAYSAGVSVDAGAGLNVHAVYSHQNLNGVDTTAYSKAQAGNKNDWGLGLDWTWNDLYLAGFYDQAEQGNITLKTYDVVAAYTLDATRLYTGYSMQHDSSVDGYASRAFLAGVEYHFNPAAFGWFEWQNSEGQNTHNQTAAYSGDVAENAFSVGMEYDF
ncbi:porin [Celerinatantimonas sp. YJH-8]|uniref:porin n=1 Tax=Celerinatantimonas sp. YJH-8 TaxID=3228714 RepID=UPI0038CB6214